MKTKINENLDTVKKTFLYSTCNLITQPQYILENKRVKEKRNNINSFSSNNCSIVNFSRHNN